MRRSPRLDRARSAARWVVLAAAASACGSSPATSPDCQPFVKKEVVESRYRAGIARLASARNGEHFRKAPFEEAMGDLRLAAENGSREAQSLYGRTLFGTLFSSRAPEAAQRSDYVSAIVFLRVAARSGDPQAVAYMPGLAEGTLPADRPPLDSLPREWVRAAFEGADDWIACHGLANP